MSRFEEKTGVLGLASPSGSKSHVERAVYFLYILWNNVARGGWCCNTGIFFGLLITVNISWVFIFGCVI